jgi:hypothetical protein
VKEILRDTQRKEMLSGNGEGFLQRIPASGFFLKKTVQLTDNHERQGDNKFHKEANRHQYKRGRYFKNVQFNFYKKLFHGHL